MDVMNYIGSCHQCQIHAPRLPKLPIEEMEAISKPFERVAIGIVGPLPMTRNKNQYILTLMDCGTRWPECSALRQITSSAVANELFIMFTRLGVPKKLSDNGQQLVSKIIKETFRLLGISQETSAPYHPQSNGIIERFNGSLKQILRKLVEDNPASWDSFLPAVLFAYRDVQNAFTGSAPSV
ncbi:gypsy retrotransposon integrase-like protein 1 [Plakobranchus ocellatus]|uniref:Gypsy retrotransposon integrase-like protein 1 n=1 Tax=Plakobranchus ocellatus TaxID=259542 RepID=A0AAV4CSF8_9GAST|nr:gypsy retrotransposon integrase-like protein 1 [Plakobranchus ocellatus]